MSRFVASSLARTTAFAVVVGALATSTSVVLAHRVLGRTYPAMVTALV